MRISVRTWQRTALPTVLRNAAYAHQHGLVTRIYHLEQPRPTRVPRRLRHTAVCARPRRKKTDEHDDEDDDDRASPVEADEFDDAAVDELDDDAPGTDPLDDFDLDDFISSRQTDNEVLNEVFDRIGLDGVSSARVEEEEPPEERREYPTPPEISMTFGELLQLCEYDEEVMEQYKYALDVEITGIQHDSRCVQPGDLFVCAEGQRFNGHFFINEAVTRGASMILARLVVPGAEQALHDEEFNIEDTDIPETDYFWKAVDRDIEVMGTAEEEIEKMRERMDRFAAEAGLSEEDRMRVRTEQELRLLESAVAYSPRDPDRDDDLLTPHPYNPWVPIELEEGPIPVVFAIDPMDFAGVLASKFYGDPSQKMITVGVTGTNGKTTTSWLMRSVFEHLGMLTGLTGTVEYALERDRVDRNGDIWEPLEEDTTLKRESSTPFLAAPYEGKYQVSCTTPDAIQIQRIMRGMYARGAQAVVSECSSIGLAQGRLQHVKYNVGIFTNLTHDHLDAHGSMQEYAEAKATLFESLTDPDTQVAVLNLDDPAYAEFRSIVSYPPNAPEPDVVAPIVTYSMNDTSADVYCVEAEYSTWETRARISTPKGDIEVLTTLIGEFNVYNILAAVAASIALDALGLLSISLETIVEAIEDCQVVPGRMELIDEGQAFPVIVDYAHSPDALQKLLSTARTLVSTSRGATDASRVIVVFGCGGDRDREKRPLMGAIADELADIVILTNDNPRTEHPAHIINDIVAGFSERTRQPPELEGQPIHYLTDIGRVPYALEHIMLKQAGRMKRHVIEDRFCAIRAAIGVATAQDIVVIAGKGHEDYMEHCTVDGEVFKCWFDDRVEARNALSKLPALDEIKYLRRDKLPWRKPGEVDLEDFTDLDAADVVIKAKKGRRGASGAGDEDDEDGAGFDGGGDDDGPVAMGAGLGDDDGRDDDF